VYRHRAGAGYPRVLGGHHYPGTGIYGAPVYGGYIGAPADPLMAAAMGLAQQQAAQALAAQNPQAAAAMQLAAQQQMMLAQGGGVTFVPATGQPAPAIVSPPWRGMVAPGTPPVGEGHEPLPLTPETFNGTWGGAAGAPAGTVILFSARPQHPFKPTRWLVRGTKSGATAIGNMIGQIFVGTDLQQGELGFIDLETIGAGGAFDTWVSSKQSEPGVWIRVQATLTAFPTPPDFETYTISSLGHYFH
jgi:hypothetical protein